MFSKSYKGPLCWPWSENHVISLQRKLLEQWHRSQCCLNQFEPLESRRDTEGRKIAVAQAGNTEQVKVRLYTLCTVAPLTCQGAHGLHRQTKTSLELLGWSECIDFARRHSSILGLGCGWKDMCHLLILKHKDGDASSGSDFFKPCFNIRHEDT